MYSENDWRSYPSLELCHHGILGQKWGIRRYQNKDGTLTEQGKQRYSTSEDRAKYFRKQLNKTDENRVFAQYFKDQAIRDFNNDLARAKNAKTDELHDRLERAADDRLAKQSENPDKWLKEASDKTAALISQAEELGLKVNSYETTRYINLGSLYIKGKGTGYQVSERITPEQKRSSVDRAKKDDIYSIDFLDAIQNKQMSKIDTIKEYETYLDDPFEYWQNRDDHLSKYKDE